MLITVKNRWLIRLIWRRWDVPEQLTAGHRLWWLWIKGDKRFRPRYSKMVPRTGYPSLPPRPLVSAPPPVVPNPKVRRRYHNYLHDIG